MCQFCLHSPDASSNNPQFFKSTWSISYIWKLVWVLWLVVFCAVVATEKFLRTHSCELQELWQVVEKSVDYHRKDEVTRGVVVPNKRVLTLKNRITSSIKVTEILQRDAPQRGNAQPKLPKLRKLIQPSKTSLMNFPISINILVTNHPNMRNG